MQISKLLIKGCHYVMSNDEFKSITLIKRVLFQALAHVLRDGEAPEVKDNACSAMAWLIETSRSQLPLKEVTSQLLSLKLSGFSDLHLFNFSLPGLSMICACFRLYRASCKISVSMAAALHTTWNVLWDAKSCE